MANPVDAHRKQLRKKEVKKNKTDRQKAREVATVKKDTRSLESEIRDLSNRSNLNAKDKSTLTALKSELAYIQKSKETYVAAHPEHRKFVYPTSQSSNGQGELDESEINSLYNRDGKLKQPKKSFYYHELYNPFGAPPPGLPYKERPPTAEELAMFQPIPLASFGPEGEIDSSEGEDDDDIEMPTGPPPGSDDSDDDEDDIEMPAGPPPVESQPKRLIPTGPAAPLISRPPPSAPTPVYLHPQPFHPNPHMRRGGYQIPQQNFSQQNFYQPQFQPHQPHPPIGTPTGPRINVDPLAAGLPAKPSHQSYHSQPKPMPSSLAQEEILPSSSELTSVKPVIGPQGFIQQSTTIGTISSEPKLRDLKAEVIAFVPTHVKRKKVVKMVGAGSIATINAAKIIETENQEEEMEEKVSLMDSLRAAGIGKNKKITGSESKADYDRFLKEMGDIL